MLFTKHIQVSFIFRRGGVWCPEIHSSTTRSPRTLSTTRNPGTHPTAQFLGVRYYLLTYLKWPSWKKYFGHLFWFSTFCCTQRLLQQQPKPPKTLSGVSFSNSDAPPGAAVAERMGWRGGDEGSTGQRSVGWRQGLQDPEIKLGPDSRRGAPPENSRGGAPSLLLGAVPSSPFLCAALPGGIHLAWGPPAPHYQLSLSPPSAPGSIPPLCWQPQATKSDE